MTIKMYMTPNVEKLTRIVEKSHGNVLLRLSDNSLRDLKNDETKDCIKFVNFMLEGCA